MAHIGWIKDKVGIRVQENENENTDDTEDFTEHTRDYTQTTTLRSVDNGINKETKIEVNQNDHIVTGSFMKEKAAAEGMMDIALLTANANQLRFLYVYGKRTASFYAVLSLIAFSLILQVLVGIGLIYRRQMKTSGNRERAKMIRHYITGAIFLVTLVNVFAASFTTTDSPIVQKANVNS